MVSRGRNAKTKGSRYELTIANKLTKLTGVKFQRTAFSGAQSNDTNNDRTWIGDIYAEKDSGFDVFNYELKAHDNVSLRNIILCNGEVPSFLEQCLTDTNRNNNTLPALIINLKNFSNLVIIPYNRTLYFDIYNKNPKLLFNQIFSYKNDRKEITYEYDMMVLDLDTFAKLSKEQLIKYYKETHVTYEYMNINKESTIKLESIDDIVKDVDTV